MEVGDKYIIEIGEIYETTAELVSEVGEKTCETPDNLYRIKGFRNLVFDEDGLDKLQQVNLETVQELAYQRGMNDAWACANEIQQLSGEERFKIIGSESPIIDFSPNYCIAKLKAYEEQKNAEEVKVGTRVRTIKDKDNAGVTLFPVGTIGVVKEIDTSPTLPYLISTDNDTFYYSRDMFEVICDDEVKVGDEVKHYADGTKAVVLDFVDDGERVMIFDKNGNAEDWELSKVRKTGRSFPEIAEVLEKMKEGEG